MGKKQFDNPAAAMLAAMENTAPAAGAGDSSAEETSKNRSERVTVFLTPEQMQALNDIANSRAIAGKKAAAGYAGKRAKKTTVSTICSDAVSLFLELPEVREELQSYREKFQ